MLTMQFVKKVPEKSARNFSDKKVTKKTQMQYDKILNFMKDDTWYKASDFMAVLDVKDRRIKVLLNELVKSKFVVDDGSTKGRRYKKKT
ncbi:hypothetical protein DW208_03865 [Erysipelotrichaceae bacterium AM17-60]|nr:hypothetical protein DW208_03865 [Erysipelotrichaceae bacterium AM17-60]